MTVKVTRVNVKTAKVRRLLAQPGVVADIRARGERVKAAAESAGIRVEGIPGRIDLPVTLKVNRKRRRARARVILDHPSGQAVEAKHGLLAGAIDAARD
jgi:hypothetical protein